MEVRVSLDFFRGSAKVKGAKTHTLIKSRALLAIEGCDRYRTSKTPWFELGARGDIYLFILLNYPPTSLSFKLRSRRQIGDKPRKLERQETRADILDQSARPSIIHLQIAQLITSLR